ncbi:TPA: hypothetical protein ACKONR_000441 [Clostridioides difficile]|uniref:hypothetical protein n=1 Tax=Clostridioides difficile TaxID=1496 RepID=UPI000C9FCFA2|nr:hypothetical protein [Clostridioides difficile]MDV9854191.1 hypothetical protein [Clostridioides difficile]HBF1102491.1 hypothetical protein [Clostridioides difficile]HBF1291791.1 hypothetical protein [Clostridioides difficile]HBF3642701.1 hypothetical protein [Clostridioides difficile]HBF6412706.1 hypothetical protein [Clostridioides difficile]
MRELDKNKINNLYLKGYKAKEIAYTLEISYESVRKYIARNCKDLKEIHKSNSNSVIGEVRKLYTKGYNAKEIAHILHKNIDMIEKNIIRNCKDLKKIHKKNNQKTVDMEEVRKLYTKGYNAKEIAHILHKNIDMIEKNIIRNCEDLKKIHKKNNQKIVDIETIRRLYTKGYSAKEIADTLNKETNTVNLCIYRNCVDLKKIHKENRIIRRDTLKLLDRHNKTHISDSSFLKYNRQSYENDRNGNLKFDDKRGSKPYDIPKKYKKNMY